MVATESPVTQATPMESPVLPKEVPQVAPMITLTEKAALAVKRIIEQQLEGNTAEKIYLRLSVQGGGCSGLKEKLDLDKSIDPKKDDLFEMHGVSVVVDRRSQMYLSGATVDFHDELNRSGFSIQNPNAKTKCGCGSSFSM
jgi:iron-sulfur cluster assembly protein